MQKIVSLVQYFLHFSIKVKTVVQVFVANPNKTQEIVEVLSTNKEKLLKYLGDFHTDKGGPPSRTSTSWLQNRNMSIVAVGS